MQAWVAQVAAEGDAARGEAVFRRADCLKCHSIAGAGGRVGPDLISIGTSAQVDYLIESIFDPSGKIKENYHSLKVATDDGPRLQRRQSSPIGQRSGSARRRRPRNRHSARHDRRARRSPACR